MKIPLPHGTILGGRVCHLHVKDAILDHDHPNAMDDGWRYLTPGTGQLPIETGVRLSLDRGYDGWLIFENEKRWHDDLAEPEEELPKFIRWINGINGVGG